jgi:hypothetical protein
MKDVSITAEKVSEKGQETETQSSTRTRQDRTETITEVKDRVFTNTSVISEKY